MLRTLLFDKAYYFEIATFDLRQIENVSEKLNFNRKKFSFFENLDRELNSVFPVNLKKI